MRIVIAEDSVLLRAGLTRILIDAGEDVVATVGDADELLTAVNRHQPEANVNIGGQYLQTRGEIG